MCVSDVCLPRDLVRDAYAWALPVAEPAAAAALEKLVLGDPRSLSWIGYECNFAASQEHEELVAAVMENQVAEEEAV